MAQGKEITAVYAAGVVQGIALVTFPAVSTILTSTGHYGLSDTEYGGMFVPQAITAVAASLLGAGLTRRLGAKGVFLIGLLADLLAMLLLFGSQFAEHDHALAYGLLLAATGSLGIGFGFVVPSINTFTAEFFPEKVESAVLTLNALLGLGTALAPIFAIIFVGFDIWWGLPLLMSGLVLALFLFSWPLPLKCEAPKGAASGKIPSRFWIFAAFAFSYGVCETMYGNWCTVYMKTDIGASATLASAALTTFWIAVTAGRVLFDAIGKWFPERWTCQFLPVLMAVAFLAAAFVPRGEPYLAIAAVGLAGLSCSALLPLVIGFGEEQLASMSAAVAGGLICCYQIGYGVAAFGVGPLQAGLKLSLSEIYGWMLVFALAQAALAYLVLHGKREE